MTVERGLRLLAGTFVLLSLALGYWVSPYWFLFTAFVGLNLIQSSFTNWCPAMMMLRRLGLKDVCSDETKHAVTKMRPSSNEATRW